MWLLSLILLIVLGRPPLTWAGSVVFNFGGTPVTLTTNANQDAKLQRLLDDTNYNRANATPPLPPLTLEQFTREVLVEELKRLNQVAVIDEAGDFCATFATLSQAQKDQIITAGGNNSPCP